MVGGTCSGAAVFSLYFQRRPARHMGGHGQTGPRSKGLAEAILPIAILNSAKAERFGNIRQPPPERARYRIAFKTSRKSVRAGRPDNLARDSA